MATGGVSIDLQFSHSTEATGMGLRLPVVISHPVSGLLRLGKSPKQVLLGVSGHRQSLTDRGRASLIR